MQLMNTADYENVVMAYLLKTDNLGQKLWDGIYGRQESNTTNIFFDIEEMGTSQLNMVGRSWDGTVNDVLFVQTEADGTMSP